MKSDIKICIPNKLKTYVLKDYLIIKRYIIYFLKK